jgi:hypothetical protein
MSWTITPQTKVPVDPQYGSVSLLLHGNGTNGSTTITDNSPSPKTVTAVGNAQISTAQSKFGGASILLDGTGDGASTTSSTAFSFDIGDFTIELWVKLNSISGNPNLFDMRPIGNGAFPSMYYDLGKLRYFFNTADQITGSIVFNTTDFYHVALARNASITRLFVNGVQDGASFSNSSAISTTVFAAGCDSRVPGLNSLNGYIDDFRVTKGVARYTANFTPPAAPFPDI